MAFPQVAAEISSDEPTNTTTHTVDMPSGSGGTLLTLLGFDARPIVSGQIPDNWAGNINTAASGDQCALRAYTLPGGAGGASQTITTDAGQCSGHHTMRLDGAAAFEVAVFQGTTGSSFDPPSLDPSWATEDVLWIPVTVNDDGTVTITGFPTNYVGTGQVNAGDAADGVTLGWARRELAAASEDPGAFTGSGTVPFCTALVAVRPVSPVSFVAAGAKSAGSATATSIAYPGSIAAGQMILAGRSGWRSDIAMANESGWTNTSELGGGTGTAVDAHTTKIRVDRKEAAGSESGSVTFDQSGSTNPGCLGMMVNYAKSPSTATWDVAQTTGDDSGHAANRSATGSGNIAFAPGDVLVAFVATDTDTNLAGFSAPALTASGITFGSTTRRSPASAGVTTGDDGNIEIFEATVTAGTGTVAPTLVFTTSTSQCGPVSFVRLRAVSGLSATIGQATETDTAQPIAKSKIKALGQAAETDTGQPVNGLRARLLGQASEVDTATSIGHSRARTLGQTTETSTAQTVTKLKLKTIGQPSEADTAGGLTYSHARTLGQPSETNLAQPVGRLKMRSLGQAVETSTALPVAESKRSVIGQAIEADVAQPVIFNVAGVIGRATETSTAFSVTESKLRALSQAVEASAAGTMQRSKIGALQPALEADQALPVTGSRVLLVGQASEVSSAGLLLISKTLVLGQVIEISTAFPVTAPDLPAAAVLLDVGELNELTTVGQLEQRLVVVELVQLWFFGELEGG